jgi:hypothetical protein
MHHLSAKELLYLEDISGICDTIAKHGDMASNTASDPQLKSYCQSLANEHRQWISSTASVVNNSSRLQ